MTLKKVKNKVNETTVENFLSENALTKLAKPTNLIFSYPIFLKLRLIAFRFKTETDFLRRYTEFNCS